MPEAPEERTVDVDVEALDTRGNRIVGYAAVYGSESGDLGGWREVIAPGAFASVLPSADVRCLLNHDPSQVLGRTRSGTLRLSDESRGLKFECDLPASPLGENVREAVRRGDVDGASFRFVVDDEEWSDDLRTVKSVRELHDVTVATYAAYPAASVELRARPHNTPAQGEEEDPMPDDREHRGGGLAVEDRSAVAGPTIEQRVIDALRDVRKGETRSLTTANTGNVTPPELSSLLFEKLRATSVALRTGIRVIPTNRESVQWPKLSSDVAPGWYAEEATITPGDPGFTTVTATPRKLAHLTVVSNEALDDSEPALLDILDRHLATMLGLKLDIGIYEGSGTAPEIRGLKNVIGIQTVSMGGNGAAITNLDPVADAIGLLEQANVAPPYVAVMPPRTWATIRKFKDTAGQPLLTETPTTDAPQRIFGVPVYASSQLNIAETQGTSNDASSIYVYAPAEVVLVRRQDAELELDRSMLFSSDQSQVRGKLRADLVAPNPAAVVRIVGVRP